MQLKSVTYTSRARLDLTASDLSAIHETARHVNALEGITGLLIFNGVHFLQIVEGSEEAIDNLIDRLRSDPRHSALEVRDERAVDMRSFPDWSMELFQVSTDQYRAQEEVGAALPESVLPAVRARVLALTGAVGAVRLAD